MELTLIKRISEAESAFTTNRDAVAPSSVEEESYSKSSTGSVNSVSKMEHSKLLGVIWDSVTDQLKRSVLKITAKIFDPLGLLSPFVIRLKISVHGESGVGRCSTGWFTQPVEVDTH